MTTELSSGGFFPDQGASTTSAMPKNKPSLAGKAQSG